MREGPVAATFAMFTRSLPVKMTGRFCLLERDEFDFGLRFGRDNREWICEFDAEQVHMKSLMDERGTLPKGGLGAKPTEGLTEKGLGTKTTEVEEDVWDLDISTWDDVVTSSRYLIA